ncbi:UvrD-helicase domain-containing protein [candidate division KSB1 bacterium]|nr:exodeoxyribonuclease V subunit gamma [bacterium]NUM68161.1 UvrD-helicase domain-containing protein [candidate division KSB1 bacterium]
MQTELGPVLVLAGAGSGKTRVLTHRLAFLMQQGLVPAENLLAVTFTNKAAQEMRERVQRLLASLAGHRDSTGRLWLGTFHSLCARLLRIDADRLGYTRQFTIYDTEDQTALLRRLLEEMTVPAEHLNASQARHRISRAKNAFIRPENYFDFHRASQQEEVIARVYEVYQHRLRENNAMDFDDLPIKPLELFEKFPEILQNYRNRFHYLLVDEFQDTNRAQYLWLKALAGERRCLFVVGDDDQSIYRWRGADLRNILNFESDYPECKIFRLEQNYRSTANILAAAHSVIVNNKNRMPKQLWTRREEGERVIVLGAFNEFHEAETIHDKIREEFGRQNGDGRNYHRSFRDFAILYRTNAQSRLIEDVLRRNGIPYLIVGGLRFYERKEVKDILAYLRLIANPADSVSLRRVINFPLRGLGEATVNKLEQFAQTNRLTLFQAVERAGEISGLTAGLRNKILEFHRFIQKYMQLKDKLSLPEWCNALVDDLHLIQQLKQEDERDRIENIRELLLAINEYTAQTPGATLDGFLERVALITDIDNWDTKGNAVTLMTLHSAKGLEFPIVFISGLEEGLFPLLRGSDDENESDLEEERRLFYVGATRAQEKLYLSYSQARSRYGSPAAQCYPSRFLEELDERFFRNAVVRRQRFYDYEEEPEPDVSMPVYEDESQETGMVRPGRWVVHASFGRGRIISVDGSGDNMKVTVHFDDAGQKKILVKYGNLRLI